MVRTSIAIIFLCILLFLPGAVPGQESVLNFSSITLERGMCYGACPVYSLTLYGNGTIIYDGQMYVKEVGTRNGTINESSYRNLIDQFTGAGFFQMKKSYTSTDITDMPSATLTFINGNRSWNIEHYHGDMSAPKSLNTLEDAVDLAANVTRWTEPYGGPSNQEWEATH